MRADSARARASATACPVASTAALSACSERSDMRSRSACTSSTMRWRSRRPPEAWSLRCPSCLAAASCDLVVISIAMYTDFCSESRVDWSTGSIAWMSMLMMATLFASTRSLPRTFPVSSTPKTDERMILADDLWKSSNVVAATAERTRDPMSLQMSPTKSGTANNFAADAGSVLSTSNCQLYESCSSSRAWSNVSTVMISVEKSGPSARRIDWIWWPFFGFPPESERTVNCSSGCSIASSGPKTTRATRDLKS
mmetsp:Transcript_8781/g.21693  ORF Transcript_8781/g.21693 Transcript_8781/m.21693 type:complete len:254 (-) Transcript_8781:1299-2060(-)